MSDKIPLREIFFAINQNAKSIWKELTDEEKKSVQFWLLNRYISSIKKGEDDTAALAVLSINEYYNKNWSAVSKHHELLWQLLCVAGQSNKTLEYEWIGFKYNPDKKQKNKTKLLLDLYPLMKLDEIELLSKITTDKELKKLIKDHALDVKI